MQHVNFWFHLVITSLLTKVPSQYLSGCGQYLSGCGQGQHVCLNDQVDGMCNDGCGERIMWVWSNICKFPRQRSLKEITGIEYGYPQLLYTYVDWVSKL